MIVLSVHNSYQQPGGEDEVFRQETRLLEEHGHEVIRCQAHNDELNGKRPLELLRKTLYNSEAYDRVRSLIMRCRPDVMHVHNTFPLLSPAVYYAAASERVPVVQTLHNYRLLCPAAVLFRKGSICEKCLKTRSFWPSAVHGCYRGSRLTTAAAAAMLSMHRVLRTQNHVTTYIALSEFARSKFVEAGMPKNKIVVKPNFTHPDPGPGDGSGAHCLFVGRLTVEKGVRTLLEAWTRFSPPLPLDIIGDGDLAPSVAAAAQKFSTIHWHGRVDKARVYERMKRAALLVLPSIWYEAFPMVVIEAFAMGLPVVASRLGAMATIVRQQSNGLHFSPGDPADLAAKVRWFHDHQQAAIRMRKEARRDFELHYTGERNYSSLMTIYGKTIARYRQNEQQATKQLGCSTESSLDLVQITSRPRSE
jgi:glycosyltransferase involved in cell wall biosynthesis